MRNEKHYNLLLYLMYDYKTVGEICKSASIKCPSLFLAALHVDIRAKYTQVNLILNASAAGNVSFINLCCIAQSV